MRGVAGERCGGRDLAQVEGGGGADTGIDEEREPTAGEVQRVLDLQLEVVDQLEIARVRPAAEPCGEAVEEPRADRVVAAAAIADGKDDDAGRHARCAPRVTPVPSRRSASTSWPSASRSSTASGILPSACVAHDRQGSNARIATSM